MSAFPAIVADRLPAEYVQYLEEEGHTWLKLQELWRQAEANPNCSCAPVEWNVGHHAVFRAVAIFPYSNTVYPFRLANIVSHSCDP